MASTGSGTKPSTSAGPRGEHPSAKEGASDPQAHRSRLATTQEEVDERARQVAERNAETVAPAQARTEAEAAERRAAASDPEQAAVERELARILFERAERHEATTKSSEARTRLLNRSAAAPSSAGSASGPVGNPLPKDLKRGDDVVYHTPGAVQDTTGQVIRVWPEVHEDPDDPKSKAQRWRADLVLFPLHGSPGTLEGIAYGEGLGQFQLASDVEVDDLGLASGENELPAPYRHEIN